jgi:hypothetical protein
MQEGIVGLPGIWNRWAGIGLVSSGNRKRGFEEIGSIAALKQHS